MTSSPDPSLPDFFRLRQRFPSHGLADIPGTVQRELREAGLPHTVRPGQSVAIAVGSRGIANLSVIVQAVARTVRAAGGDPFVVPAMGSHGGGTAEGQAAVLASFGITPQAVDCPIRSSMDTVVAGRSDEGLEIHFDRLASEADHVIVINRIKPHTRLVGRYESGLAKMLMIGLGKHRGALLYHQIFPEYDYRLDRLAPSILPLILQRMPVTYGVAIVEDAFESTSKIEVLRPDQFLEREPQLLEIARSWMPRLPFEDVDLLIVDKIGKEISGTGMDTNVVGRKSNDKCAAPDESPQVRQIYVRSLSKKTAGNAAGIGIAEYCHRRVVEAMNHEVTRINCVTSAHVTAGAIPLTFASDRDVLEAARTQVGRIPTDQLKWLWISDTLHLDEVSCSRAYWDRAHDRHDMEPASDPAAMVFDAAGDLVI